MPKRTRAYSGGWDGQKSDGAYVLYGWPILVNFGKSFHC